MFERRANKLQGGIFFEEFTSKTAKVALPVNLISARISASA